MKSILPFVRRTLFSLLSAVGLNTPTRIVIFLSPVFIAASGYVVAIAARYLPLLPRLDRTSVANLFAVGSIAMAAKLLLWLHGAQKAEAPTLAAHLGEFIGAPMAGPPPLEVFGSAFAVAQAGSAGSKNIDPEHSPLVAAFHEVGEA